MAAFGEKDPRYIARKNLKYNACSSPNILFNGVLTVSSLSLVSEYLSAAAADPNLKGVTTVDELHAK